MSTLTKKLTKKQIKNKIKQTLKNLETLRKESKKRIIKKKLKKTTKHLKKLRKKSIKKIKLVDKIPVKIKKPGKKIKIKTEKVRTPDTRGKNFYAADRYEYYNIHKSTLLSFYPTESCQAIINVLGQNNVSNIQDPPDKFLAARGIKWVRCLKFGKAEFHFCPPWHLRGEKYLKEISVEQQFEKPYKTQFFESHVGMYIPDLTECAIRAKNFNYNHMIVQRQDGLYQLYVHLPGCLSWVEFDSITANLRKLKDNGIKIITFEQANEQGLKLQQAFFKKYGEDGENSDSSIVQIAPKNNVLHVDSNKNI